jgi:uncharacterized protein YecT (DUF1311 family)
LKLQAVLVAWHNLRREMNVPGAVEVAVHNLRMILEDRDDDEAAVALDKLDQQLGALDDLACLADELRDRLEELEAIVGCETPANLFA